ncbi:MAG: hypothetical protein QOF85_2545 [Solirubrobacterales bacterium]|jgi:hypothetical protein|nr:hypothetical protein [Solirubrobacterales bacterium]
MQGVVGDALKAEAPDVQGLLLMELAGLEPATSWVRSNGAKSER